MQAIARGATRVRIGGEPSTSRASISSVSVIEPSSAASPAPSLPATSRDARIGPVSTSTALGPFTLSGVRAGDRRLTVAVAIDGTVTLS